MLSRTRDIAAILLGSNKFPHFEPSLSNDAYANLNNLFRYYLTSDEGLCLKEGEEEGELLDLFGSPLSVLDQDLKVTKFVKENTAKRTILIYFVGHGGFSYNQEYFLALQSTRPDKKYLTGYRIGDLAQTLRDAASDRDIILVLDCCFAGEAVKAFMPIGITEVVEKKT